MAKNKISRFPVIEAIIAFFVYLFHYTELIDISVYHASPLILLPITVGVAMFYDELTGLLFGLCCGCAMDAVTGGVFNTIFFMLMGFAVSLLAQRIFNKNLPGAIAVTFISTLIYYGMKWFINYLLPDVQGKVYILLWHYFPSVIYTVLFIIPFYFFEKRLRTPKTKK